MDGSEFSSSRKTTGENGILIEMLFGNGAEKAQREMSFFLGRIIPVPPQFQCAAFVCFFRTMFPAPPEDGVFFGRCGGTTDPPKEGVPGKRTEHSATGGSRKRPSGDDEHIVPRHRHARCSAQSLCRRNFARECLVRVQLSGKPCCEMSGRTASPPETSTLGRFRRSGCPRSGQTDRQTRWTMEVLFSILL